MNARSKGAPRPTRVACAAFALAAMHVSCAATPAPFAPRPSRAPVAAPRALPGDLDARVLLGDAPDRATRLGAGAITILASGETVEGERLGSFVEASADECLLVYARGSSSVEDLDVAIFAEEGNPLSVDEAPDAHPTVLLCPPHPARVYASVHTAGGEGLVALAAHHVPRDRAADVARSLGARGGYGQGPRPAEAWPGLDEIVRAHRDALGGTWEEIRKVAVTVDARTTTYVPLPVEADQCTDAVLVSSDDVALLEVDALDAEGHIVGRARDGTPERTVTVCSAAGFSGSLAIRPHVGAGLVAVALARAKGEEVRELSSHPDVAWSPGLLPIDKARDVRGAELTKRGYAAPTKTSAGTLAMGRRALTPLDFGSNPSSCSRIDVVAGAPLALLVATVWDSGGSLIGSEEGTGSVTLFACGRGRARLDLETRGRPGPFSMSVRAERWKDAAFSAFPLAASRMLARAAVGPLREHEGAPLPSRSLTVDASRLVSWERTIEAGKCLRVAAGVQGEGTGVELRVFDGTGEDIDRSHGQYAAATRACAPADASKTVHVELRVTSGRLDVVVGERI